MPSISFNSAQVFINEISAQVYINEILIAQVLRMGVPKRNEFQRDI